MDLSSALIVLTGSSVIDKHLSYHTVIIHVINDLVESVHDHDDSDTDDDTSYDHLFVELTSSRFDSSDIITT